MGARQTKNEFMDHEWEFDTYEEMMAAAVKEARVCGDGLDEAKDKKSVMIWNCHQQSVRWKGVIAGLIEDCKDCTSEPGHSVNEEEFTVTLTRGEIMLLREGDGTDIEVVIADILRQLENVT